MANADPDRIVREIYVLFGRPSQQELNYQDVHAARIEAGMEILRAIAKNPQNSYHGSLTTSVAVAHDQFMPPYDGEPGIPSIVPFDGAQPISGYPADPDEIDSYRNDLPELAIYSGALDGTAVAHDAADENGMPSQEAGKYVIVDGRFKFTGFSAEIPLIQLTRSMADTGVPENYEPTIIKLSIPWLVKPGDRLYELAPMYRADGKQDLIEIAGGAMKVNSVRPVPSIVTAQKEAI